MSQFECNIADLVVGIPNKPTPVENISPLTRDQEKPTINEEPISREHNVPVKTDNNSKPTKMQPNLINREDSVITSLLDELKDKKNHKIFFIIIGLYILLNSDPVYKLTNDMFPYLMNTVSQVNLSGKVVIAVIIASAVIISKSSLLNLF